MNQIPAVSNCQVTNCAFNDHGCNAFAMTMGDKGCVTFIELGVRGGLNDIHAKVGACQRADCTHNHNLECGASAIDVAGNADCLMYESA